MGHTDSELKPEVKIVEKNLVYFHFPGRVIWLVSNPEFLPLSFESVKINDAWGCKIKFLLVYNTLDDIFINRKLEFRLYEPITYRFEIWTFNCSLQNNDGSPSIQMGFMETRYDEVPNENFIRMLTDPSVQHWPWMKFLVDPRPESGTIVDSIIESGEVNRSSREKLYKALLYAFKPSSC